MENKPLKVLEFENPVVELQGRIEDLKRGNTAGAGEIARLMDRLAELERKVYRDLSAWERVSLARHPMRPTTNDYIRMIFDEFEELHGDRYFGDDPAVIGGIAKLGDQPVMLVGHEKGRTTRERIARNFGMARPEGFRKALRLMKMAEKFNMPIVSFVDTPGAYPGIDAEERGQPRAIADSLKEVFDTGTPIIVVIIGEGGSGGALALAVGDVILMLEHAIYSVISPEGCAAILWNSRDKAADAASALKLTSADCLRFGVIDAVINESHGAAHRDPEGCAGLIKEALLEHIEKFENVPAETLLRRREERFLALGDYGEV